MSNNIREVPQLCGIMKISISEIQLLSIAMNQIRSEISIIIFIFVVYSFLQNRVKNREIWPGLDFEPVFFGMQEDISI